MQESLKLVTPFLSVALSLCGVSLRATQCTCTTYIIIDSITTFENILILLQVRSAALGLLFCDCKLGAIKWFGNAAS